VQAAAGRHDRGRRPNEVLRLGHLERGRRPGRGQPAPPAPTRALQGQGRHVPGREDKTQGGQGRQGGQDRGMIKRTDRKQNRSKRHRRVRVHVAGTQERPRLAVFRSLNHVYAQLLDDGESRTLAAASTVTLKSKKNGMAEAAKVGKEIAAKAKAAGVSSVVFDRGGFLYHGRIKALADAAREAGLEF